MRYSPSSKGHKNIIKAHNVSVRVSTSTYWFPLLCRVINVRNASRTSWATLPTTGSACRARCSVTGTRPSARTTCRRRQRLATSAGPTWTTSTATAPRPKRAAFAAPTIRMACGARGASKGSLEAPRTSEIRADRKYLSSVCLFVTTSVFHS